MINEFYTSTLEKLGTFLYKNNPKYEINVYIFGLDLLLYKSVFLFSILLYGLLAEKLLESIVFLVTFEYLRKYCGGLHFHHRLTCFIISMIISIFNIESCRYTSSINPLYIVIISLIIVFIAPIDTMTKKLDIKEKSEYKKRIIFVIVFINILILSIQTIYLPFASLLTLILFTQVILLLLGIMSNKIIQIYMYHKNKTG